MSVHRGQFMLNSAASCRESVLLKCNQLYRFPRTVAKGGINPFEEISGLCKQLKLLSNHRTRKNVLKNTESTADVM
jgi:hypothetical protein